MKTRRSVDECIGDLALTEIRADEQRVSRYKSAFG